jgi:hypothetical protein
MPSISFNMSAADAAADNGDAPDPAVCSLNDAYNHFL